MLQLITPRMLRGMVLQASVEQVRLENMEPSIRYNLPTQYSYFRQSQKDHEAAWASYYASLNQQQNYGQPTAPAASIPPPPGSTAALNAQPPPPSANEVNIYI